jgi:general secretion pathway protein D
MNLFPFVMTSFILTSCNKLVESRYLSSNVSESSIKEMTESADGDTFFTPPRKQSEKCPTIPHKFMRRISLTMNERLPVRSVLRGIARKLGIDVHIDPSIKANTILQASERPLINVLDTICDMANLRYSIQNDSLIKIVRDDPYTETYNMQFLNLSRDSENKISIATEVSATPLPEPDRSAGQSHDSVVTVHAKSDFWSELDDGIKLILGDDRKGGPRFSINRQSGVVVVCANSKIHRSVAKYLAKIKESISSQVLIEAKIIEVALKNEYRRGIDWNIVSKRSAIVGNLATNSAGGLDGTRSPMTFSYKLNKMHSILSALEEFGSTRTISNPRITAMNNQAAVLKVAQNHVYFKLNYDKTYASSDSKREDIAVSSDIKTIPIGLVLFVHPSIDVPQRTVTLFLRPTITKLAGTVQDPAVDIAIRSINSNDKSKYEPSKIPVTEVREVASVLRLGDGEVAVLGGFMEVRSLKNRASIPFIERIPIVGEATSSSALGDTVVELVILIRVRIIGDVNEHERAAADVRLQRFVQDPRPFMAS